MLPVTAGDRRLAADLVPGHHGVAGPLRGALYDDPMALPAHPHVAPDPFDEEINALLADPAFIAELDRRHRAVKDGTATLHDHNEARRIVGLDPASEAGRR